MPSQVDRGVVLGLTFGVVEALTLRVLILCSSFILWNLRYLELNHTLDRLGLLLVSL